MSDKQKKTDVDDAKDDSKVVKKTVSASKKTKAKDNAKEKSSANKRKVIEKLQAMGVMDGGSNHSLDNKKTEKKDFPAILFASVIAVLVVGSFIWVLNKNTSDEQVASNINSTQLVYSNTTQPTHPGSWQPSQNNNTGYPAYNPADQGNNYEENQQQVKEYQAQQQKWMQQQQKAREQYRLQQQQWMQQQQQLRAQQRTQQQQWLKEQQQRAQQQAQEQLAQQQQRPQQSYNNYPSYSGYQGRPVSPSYNYAPYYQQQGAYYGRQY